MYFRNVTLVCSFKFWECNPTTKGLHYLIGTPYMLLAFDYASMPI